jgi:alpha-tubulin suppressor-like RCC1 family protein
VSLAISHPDGIGDGGTATRLSPFSVPGLSGVQQVSAGASRTCALLGNGSVNCWGDNANGALGDGTEIARLAPVRANISGAAVALEAGAGSKTCAVLAAGGVSCWGGLVGGAAPEVVPGFDGVTQLAGGADHVCGLAAGTGAVRCFGGNTFGQLGDGTTTTNLTQAAAVTGLSGVLALASGTFHSCAVLGTGQVHCWGSNSSGQLGDGTTTDRATPTLVTGIAAAIAVGGGDNHTCAIVRGGSMQCWGNHDVGQLGQGARANRLTPVPVAELGGAAVSVAAGQNHTCALLADGSARCWGSILGDGSNFSSPVPVRVLAP